MAARVWAITGNTPTNVVRVSHDLHERQCKGTSWNDGPVDCRVLWLSRDAQGDETVVSADHWILSIAPGGYLEIPDFVHGLIQVYADADITVRVSMRDEKAFEEVD